LLRSGLTLVELLVTMVVISILSSLSLAGLSVARTSAKKAKTAATIRKISEIILPYYEEFETRRLATGNASALATMPNGRNYLADFTQTKIRRLMTLELPERASDIAEVAAWIATPLTSLKRVYAGQTVSFDDKPPAARRYYSLTSTAGTVTSSELLHLIVTRGPVADPDIISHFREDEVRDTNGNGLLEFVDGWNRPIQFRRWPIGFASPMQPIDGTRRTIEPRASNNGHRLVPLIFSAGPDGAYDIAGNLTSGNDVDYSKHYYDPFERDSPSSTTLRLSIPTSAATLPGSMVLSGTILPAGPLVFNSYRVSSSGALPTNAFLTIGSECDVDSPDGGGPDGILQFRDNIHNHDMTR
jgi:prepilin-type N-terminal cleavage/methylation domain-containing protein